MPNSKLESKVLLLDLVVRQGLVEMLDKCKVSFQLDQEVLEINVQLCDYSQCYPLHLKFSQRADLMRGAKYAN